MYSTYKKLSDISLRQKSTFTDILENEANAVSNNSRCFFFNNGVWEELSYKHLYFTDSMFYNNLWLIHNGKIIVNQTKGTVTHCMIIIPNIKYYKINIENVNFVIGDGDSPSVIYCHLWDLFLKKNEWF